MIIEGIPSTLPPFLVVTVESVSHSDDASNVSLLCDHLKVSQEQQAKVNQAIIQSITNLNGNKIHKKGADMMTKMVVQSKSDTFPPLPTECTDTTMGEWMDNNHSIL